VGPESLSAQIVAADDKPAVARSASGITYFEKLSMDLSSLLIAEMPAFRDVFAGFMLMLNCSISAWLFD
jgi:hypothetical protein